MNNYYKSDATLFMCRRCKKITPDDENSNFCVDSFDNRVEYCNKCFDGEMKVEHNKDPRSRVIVPTNDFYTRHAKSCLEEIQKLSEEMCVCMEEIEKIENKR